MRQQYSDIGPRRASEVISFLEDHFLLEGGKPIRFEPWQKEHVLTPVFERDKLSWHTFLIVRRRKTATRHWVQPLRSTVCFWTRRVQKSIARQAAIVQDAEAYQHLLDIPVEGIRQGIDDVAHRRTFPRRKTYLMTRKTSR